MTDSWVKSYFEVFDFVYLAIKREKQIKGFSMTEKIFLIIFLIPDGLTCIIMER